MSSFAYVVIALVAGFVFGFLVKHLLAAPKLAQANARAEGANARASAASEEIKRLEAEYSAQSLAKENAVLRRNNATLNDALRKCEAELARRSESTSHSNPPQKQPPEAVADAEIVRDQRCSDEYLSLIDELRKVSYQPEVESRIMALLNHRSAPDLSEGVVYVKRDLSIARYHYIDHCDPDLVLASKATMKKVGFKPCPCCYNVQQPVTDPLVALSSAADSVVYHYVGSACIQHGGSVVPLSHAISIGRRPCNMCRPIPNQPKVWY